MKANEYAIEEILDVLHPVKWTGDMSLVFSELSYDTRHISTASRSLFFALKGTQDGHKFIAQAYELGVRQFVVSKWNTKFETYKDAVFVQVLNTLEALQTLASWHRHHSQIPVIGITGSNGKTIVKEWLYQMLSADCHVVQSPKSYNSQIGVPLSVWGIHENHQLGIFEAGISQQGEMEHLEKMIAPSIGILTNIGNAHDEGFEDRKQKMLEKIALFKNAEVLITCLDFLPLDITQLGLKQVFSYSFTNPWANLYIEQILVGEDSSEIISVFEQTKISITIPFTDIASIQNACMCWATMLYLGYENKLIASRMLHLSAIGMRLELKQGINNCVVIDDSYSCDLASLQIALRFLAQQTRFLSKTLILSDIIQSGMDAEKLYQEVAYWLLKNQITRLIGIGNVLPQHQSVFTNAGIKTLFFPTKEEFLKQITTIEFDREGILIKGARQFQFEEISRALTQKQHQTVMQINLNAILHNLNAYRNLLQEGVKTMAMVKAFSYGSGSYEIANLLQYHNVDYLCVAYADEGVELRDAQIHLPIMVMNPDEASFETLLQNDLQPEIYSFSLLNSFIHFLQKKNIKHYPIHLKIDTGMKRLGFDVVEIDVLLARLQQQDAVKVQSILSHLVASDDATQDHFTQEQINLFSETCFKIEQTLGYPFIKHICNTSGVSRWKEAHFDMVRLGIGLYGIDNAMETSLHPAVAIKTTIAQIKKVKHNETIGYSRKGLLPQGGTIATVKIGYADGYLRRLSNAKAYMMVKGKKAPIVGNICMDMCMLDISEINNVKEGDEVIVIGDGISVQQMAVWLDTIPYEILTSISQRVKRIYYYE